MASLRWRRFLGAALVAPALALLAAACGDDAGPPSTLTATATPAMTPTPTGAGFLPTLTPEPTATKVPGARSGILGDCPPQPRATCARPGDKTNVYRDVNMDRAVLLRASFYGEPNEWVLEPSQIAEVLASLDLEVVMEAYAMDGPPTQDRGEFSLEITWPRGEEPIAGFPMRDLDFRVSLNQQAIGYAAMGVQWQIPAEFSELLFGYLSDVAPTPPPPRPPRPTPPPTPTIIAPGAIYFEHPNEELVWDGPDDRVSTVLWDHCGGRNREFGVPGHITVLGVQHALGLWGGKAIPREDGWRWTGYYHGDWQIWQGDDPLTAYIVHADEEGIAFEYHWLACR